MISFIILVLLALNLTFTISIYHKKSDEIDFIEDDSFNYPNIVGDTVNNSGSKVKSFTGFGPITSSYNYGTDTPHGVIIKKKPVDDVEEVLKEHD